MPLGTLRRENLHRVVFDVTLLVREDGEVTRAAVRSPPAPAAEQAVIVDGQEGRARHRRR